VWRQVDSEGNLLAAPGGVDSITGQPTPPTVQLSGSNQDLRGLLADRPAAAPGNRGVTYWAVDKVGAADEISVSTGSAWVNL